MAFSIIGIAKCQLSSNTKFKTSHKINPLRRYTVCLVDAKKLFCSSTFVCFILNANTSLLSNIRDVKRFYRH